MTWAPKILFVISEDYYFLSHRMGLARDLINDGWRVSLATQVNSDSARTKIEEAGIQLHPTSLRRGKLVDPGDIQYLLSLVALYRRVSPDIVHHVAMKPVLYGSLASLTVPGLPVVNALAGLGYLYTHSTGLVTLIRSLLTEVFSRLFARHGSRLILQNREDIKLFQDKLGLAQGQLCLIRGAGVELAAYRIVEHGPRDIPIAIMVSRMLRDKGVGELIEAAGILESRGVRGRILLVGGTDEGNPNSLKENELTQLNERPNLQWLGHRDDIPNLYAGADLAVLPSYREGLPKSLLEAAASGLPIVTTNTSGCREVVDDGRNGYLVPVGDAQSLADALERLFLSATLRARMGAAARRRAETEFSSTLIIAETKKLYQQLLPPQAPRHSEH